MTNQILAAVPYHSHYKVSPNVLSPIAGQLQQPPTSATSTPPRPQQTQQPLQQQPIIKQRTPSFSSNTTSRSNSSLPTSATSGAPQHKRSYQACIPCRRRKVRCDLGSVEAPHSPPCARCRRESKECFFSATRRRSAGEAMGEDEGSVSGASDGPKRKRMRSGTPSESALYPAVLPTTLPTKPPSGDGSLGAISTHETSPTSDGKYVDEDTSSQPSVLSQNPFSSGPLDLNLPGVGNMGQAFNVAQLGYNPFTSQGGSMDALMMKFFAIFVRMSRNLNAQNLGLDPKNLINRDGAFNGLFQEFMARFFATLNNTPAFTNPNTYVPVPPHPTFPTFPDQNMDFNGTENTPGAPPLRIDTPNIFTSFGKNTAADDLDLYNEGLILGGNGDDWMGLPMDPLFGNTVGQNHMAPDVGGMDLLDLLMDDGAGGVLN